MFSCITVNDLSEVSFIGGTQISLAFDVFDVSGIPVNLSAATTTWSLSPYGDPNTVVLRKNGWIGASPVNRFIITLSASDTVNLYGKYVHQPLIRDYQGLEYRPSQGLITIIPSNRPL